MTPYPIYLRPLVRGVTPLGYKSELALLRKAKPLQTIFIAVCKQQGFLQSLPHSDLRNKESNVSRIQVYPHKM
tara:strand:+ start:79 stop:297 length:219 start_codon:yes stop_codon:yes gene_type:complete